MVRSRSKSRFFRVLAVVAAATLTAGMLNAVDAAAIPVDTLQPVTASDADLSAPSTPPTFTVDADAYSADDSDKAGAVPPPENVCKSNPNSPRPGGYYPSRYQHCFFYTTLYQLAVSGGPNITCKKADTVEASAGINGSQTFTKRFFVDKWRDVPNPDSRCSGVVWTTYVGTSNTAQPGQGYWFSYVNNTQVDRTLTLAPPTNAAAGKTVTNDVAVTFANVASGGPTAAGPSFRVRCDYSPYVNRSFTTGQNACMFPSPIPVLEWSRQSFPGITTNMTTAFNNGAPTRLSRLWSDTNAYDDNVEAKDAACATKPRPTGTSCDEYPYATTGQGLGFGPGSVKYVAVSEQNAQGGRVSRFYSAQRLIGGGDGNPQGGNRFDVTIVS